MRAYLIDPAERTLTVVDHDGKLSSIYELLGCDRVTTAQVADLGDVVYVDDEGLLKGPTNFFLVEGHPTPLAGKGLVVGTTYDGDDAEPNVTEEWLRDNLDFGAPMKMGSLLMFVGDRHMREIH